MKEPTPTQLDVFDYLCRYFAQNDQIPPNRTIADNFGWSSANTAKEHLKGLAECGLIERNDNGKWRFADRW